MTSTGGVETERGGIYWWCCEIEREVISASGVETERERRHLPVVLSQ